MRVPIGTISGIYIYIYILYTTMNINQQMLEMLQSIYHSTAASCVKLSNNTVSESFPCQKEVHQGRNLSPLLFHLFTADLQKELRKNKSGVYRAT